MKLTEFIKELGGPMAASKKLKTTRSAVSQWNIGAAIPNSRMMMKIVKISKGRCSYKNMIEPYHRNNEKKQSMKISGFKLIAIVTNKPTAKKETL